VDACGDDFFVWSGCDELAVPLMSVGARGLVSVLSNVRPKQTVQMIGSCLSGDFRFAGKLQTSLMPLIDALFSEVNPIPVKRALALMGFDVGVPRLPLTPLTQANEERLRGLLTS